MKIEFETTKGKFLAVSVPIDANSFEKDKFSGDKSSMNYKTELNFWKQGDFFYDGDAEIIGLFSKLTEDNCKLIVEDLFGISYKNYFNPSPENKYAPTFDFYTALESFKSLMQLNKIYTANPFGEEPMVLSHTITPTVYVNDVAWRKAQERTSEEWLILKKK